MSLSFTDIFQTQRRQVIIDYLLTHHNAFQRTQVSIMRDLAMSQATLVKYLAELKGEGLVVEKPFGTAVVYEISYDIYIARGLAQKYERFDLDRYLTAKGQRSNQEWTGKVFSFGDMTYVYARHKKSGFTIGIPVFDKEWRELVEGIALGLNLEAVITAVVSYFKQK